MSRDKLNDAMLLPWRIPSSPFRDRGKRFRPFSGDATADLDYTSPFALKSPNNHTTDASRINQPAILRSSTNPSQNASLILPANGQAGSLGDNSNIWIEVMEYYRLSVAAKK